MKEYTVSFILTVSLALIGMYIDLPPEISPALTVTILFALASTVAGAFTVNVAAATSLIGVVKRALISLPETGAVTCTAPIPTLLIFFRSCSFCTVLNVGRFVAPLMFALEKFVFVITAPEKFTLLKFAPENDTPETVVPASEAPDKSTEANDAPGETIWPWRAVPAAVITIEYVVFAGA